MKFEEFRNFIKDSVVIIIADLDNLQKIADGAMSNLTTIETTMRPDDKSFNQTIASVRISRCTIPIVMICFSVIDMVGQWLKENQDDDFGGSAHNFFKKLTGLDDLKNLTSQDKLKEFFRHGIMHSFFAKRGYGVSYLSYDSNSLFVDAQQVGTTLDAKYLLKTVRAGLANLIQEVENEDSTFAQKTFSGYLLWLKK